MSCHVAPGPPACCRMPQSPALSSSGALSGARAQRAAGCGSNKPGRADAAPAGCRLCCCAGLGGAWIGLTVQHCGNHGAMSTNAQVNGLLGTCDDLIGGSSLMWRYHHQVSHHIHCSERLTHWPGWGGGGA